MATLTLNEREVYVYFAGIDLNDYPDFCDAYIDEAVWEDSGLELTDKEVEQLYELYEFVINELVHDQIF